MLQALQNWRILSIFFQFVISHLMFSCRGEYKHRTELVIVLQMRWYIDGEGGHYFLGNTYSQIKYIAVS